MWGNKIIEFYKKYPQEGKKEGRYSFAGKRDDFIRYIRGLKVIQGISEKEKPANLKKARRAGL